MSEAVLILRNREIDISDHRTRPMADKDLWDADLIVAMTPLHQESILAIDPKLGEKMIVFNIDDPVGMGMVVYEKTFHEICAKFKEHWKEIIKLPARG